MQVQFSTNHVDQVLELLGKVSASLCFRFYWYTCHTIYAGKKFRADFSDLKRCDISPEFPFFAEMISRYSYKDRLPEDFANKIIDLMEKERRFRKLACWEDLVPSFATPKMFEQFVRYEFANGRKPNAVEWNGKVHGLECAPNWQMLGFTPVAVRQLLRVNALPLLTWALIALQQAAIVFSFDIFNLNPYKQQSPEAEVIPRISQLNFLIWILFFFRCHVRSNTICHKLWQADILPTLLNCYRYDLAGLFVGSGLTSLATLLYVPVPPSGQILLAWLSAVGLFLTFLPPFLYDSFWVPQTPTALVAKWYRALVAYPVAFLKYWLRHFLFAWPILLPLYTTSPASFQGISLTELTPKLISRVVYWFGIFVLLSWNYLKLYPQLHALSPGLPLAGAFRPLERHDRKRNHPFDKYWY